MPAGPDELGASAVVGRRHVDSCPWSFSARYTCSTPTSASPGGGCSIADTYCSSSANFGDWGFSNTISSWVNKSSHTVSA